MPSMPAAIPDSARACTASGRSIFQDSRQRSPRGFAKTTKKPAKSVEKKPTSKTDKSLPIALMAASPHEKLA